MKITYNQIKKMSKDLSSLLKETPQATSHSAILESFSHTLGFADFNALSNKLKRIEIAENAKNIAYNDWLVFVKNNESSIKYGEDARRNYAADENDKEIYLDSIEMNLYDFCTLYFKRTCESRRYSPESSYFELNGFVGNTVISIFESDITKRVNREYPLHYDNRGLFFVFKSFQKITSEHDFEVTFYDNGKNVVLRYWAVEDFVLDFLDFCENSDFGHGMRPEHFKDLMMQYSAVFTSYMDAAF